MSKAIIMSKTGGPEVLEWKDHDLQAPKDGEVLLRHEAVGLNYIDIYHRTGEYPLPSFPAIPGMEGAGIVETLGSGVTGLSIGDRVAYGAAPPGAYAEKRIIPANRLVKLPDQISSEMAAAMMMQGMTASYLIRSCYPVRSGDTILVHAAAGGVGLIMCQWAKHLGAKVIGTVGSEEKADLARSNGCEYPVLYKQEDFVQKVNEITGGKGVAAVYDSVGKATFMNSLDCLRPIGTMIYFGQSSGPVPAFDPSILGAKGSLFLTKPSIMTYTAARQDLLFHAQGLFDLVMNGTISISICQTYPLTKAAQAHKDMETGKTKGSSILTV